MATVEVGMREFRENMASYVANAQGPIAVTRHGDSVGLFIPARPKRSETERRELREASNEVQKMLASKGLTEEELMDDFKRQRTAKRR